MPEKLEFKEAKTVEEGISFAKNILGIKNVDKTFSLEAINFVNKGLVDVSNANKGKCFMPTSLKFREMKKAIASSNGIIDSANFGTLSINKKFFDFEYLKKLILPTEKTTTEATKNITKTSTLGINFSKETQALRLRLEAGEKLSITEIRKLYETARESLRQKNIIQNNPLKFLKENANMLQKEGIKFNYDEFAKLPLKEQRSQFEDLLSKFYYKTGKRLEFNEQYNPLSTIYHEMGHFQDFAKNGKTMDLKDTLWEKITSLSSKNDTFNRASRWTKRTDYNGKVIDLLKNNPDELKKQLPDLFEHLTNSNYQDIAAKVSNYAKEGVGEFVAEVYAGLISGTKYTDDVLTLYKKYNGPMPNIM